MVDDSVDISASVVSEQHAGPPSKHSSGSEASNKEQCGTIGFNKDFSYINAKAACIKCGGDGWMPRYWHQHAHRQLPGMPRHFDPLADKTMCGHCCNKYLLGLYYFPEYRPYIMEAEVERVRMESQVDYINPAEKAAKCFEKYCVQEKPGEVAAQLCPPVPARGLTVGSLVQLNSVGFMIESAIEYDWSTDPLEPQV